MRILIVTTSFPSNPDDASGAFVAKFMKALEQSGQSCCVLTPASTCPSDWPDSSKVLRFRYAPWVWQRLAQQPGGIPNALEKNSLFYVLVPFFLASLARSVARLATKFDLIHAHWSINGALSVITRGLHNRPVVTTLHGSDHAKGLRGKGPFAWFHRKAVLESEFVVAVSRAIVHQMETAFPERSSVFRFIPNGVDNEFYIINPDERPCNLPLRILYVGSLIPVKGVDILLKALTLVEGSAPVKTTIVGTGPEYENLSDAVSSLGLRDKVQFLGPVSPNDVPNIMAEHHLLVLPSYREGRPSVVLEAMAAAMPVVASRIDGTRELVKHGETGWLFPAGDAEGLAAILSSIMRGEKDLRAAGVAGRRWMLENKMTWKETASQYIELYKSAVASRDAVKTKVSSHG